MLHKYLEVITNDKTGVEIGGPSSSTGVALYKHAFTMDNVIFSNNTIWSKHAHDYNYYPGKKGKVFINDAVDITSIKDNTYDFLFASHCLEHIANPLKAIIEWKRIMKDNGFMILILPEKSLCFDHKRNVSSFETLLNQYNNNVGEDDLSTLDEILANHDLSMDKPAGNIHQFKARSLDNYNNRCLHHYVYSPTLLREICEWANCQYIYTETNGINIWFIVRKLPSPVLLDK